MAHLREFISHVALDEGFFELLRKAGNREAIRRALVGTYFPDWEEAVRRLIVEDQASG